MRIAAVNTFLAPNFSALKNNKSSNNTKNTNNDYQLPNYKLSFGMSKAAINRRRSGLNYETKEEIQNAAKEMTSPRYGTEDVYNRMDMLVKKFNDNKDALKYIFECSDIKDTPVGANLAVAYLWALRDNRDEQEWANGEWKKFFTEVLCDTKNQSGQTIPQIFANNALVLNEVFDAADNHPDILYAILTNTDDDGISLGGHVAYNMNNSAYNLLNEKIYNLAWHDQSLSLSDAIHLLDINRHVLDKGNAKLLKSLLNEDFNRF